MSKRTARFHIHKTAKGEWRPSLKAPNGQHVAGTETYKTETSARQWINRMIAWVGDATLAETVIDKTGKGESK